MKIIVPKIEMKLPQTKKKLDLFIGINISIDGDKISFSGGFVKERTGTSKTIKAKKQKKKDNEEQSEKLESKKGGEITI